MSNTQPPRTVPRRRRSDGERSRAAILQSAARLATIEGIDGLSIGRLAEAAGMSKSGLFAHFGSKQELQLATMEAARATFAEQVVEPASQAGTGIARLRALTDHFLRHVEARVYPGGCFFASVAAELDARRGPVRDVAVAFMDDWLERLATAARDAVAEGALDPACEPEQLAFELEGFMLVANFQFVITDSPEPIRRARQAIDRRIASAERATNLP